MTQAKVLPPPFPVSLTSHLDCRWLDVMDRGGRGQQGLAAVTARGLLENVRAAAPRLLRARHSPEEQEGLQAGDGVSLCPLPSAVAARHSQLSVNERLCSADEKKQFLCKPVKRLEGLVISKASPGAAKSGTVFLFLLGFYCEWILKTKSCKSALFLSCLIYKISAVCESGLCRIHSSEGNLAHILQYHPPSAVDVL